MSKNEMVFLVTCFDCGRTFAIVYFTEKCVYCQSENNAITAGFLKNKVIC